MKTNKNHQEFLRRSGQGCICCNSFNLKKSYGLVSPFFAERALALKDTFVLDVLFCKECGTRFFDINVSDLALQNLYADYRGESYFRQRNRLEPWYTKAVNDSLGNEEEFAERRKVCVEALAAAHIKNDFKSVLDHGGDKGQMLAQTDQFGIKALRRAVYEISGIQTDSGVESVSYDDLPKTKWDLILSCHVLEHLPNPSEYISNLVELGEKGTIYFFEVPNEQYKTFNFNGSSIQLMWMKWLIKFPSLLRLFYFLSSGVRIKLGFVLPFLFPVMVEHLNYFSVDGMVRLCETKGLNVKYSAVGSAGHIVVVAVK